MVADLYRFMLFAMSLIIATVSPFMGGGQQLPTVSGSFQVFAHLLVGGLIGGAIASAPLLPKQHARANRLCCGVLEGMLCVVELICFLLQKTGGGHP